MSAQSIPVSCFGAADGGVELSFSGGTPNYHLIGDSVGLSQLPSGIYAYTASDANGCLSSVAANISEPAELVLEVETTPETDFSGNGTITATASGGTQPYSFYLNDTLSSTWMWEQLPAGTYGVEVQDSMGCTTQAEVLVEFVESIPNDAIEQRRLYPNPVVRGERVCMDSSEPIREYRLMNSQGQCVWRGRSSGGTHCLDSAQLPAGCYTCILSSGKNRYTSRLVVVD
jgi:hypothetical protein